MNPAIGLAIALASLFSHAGEVRWKEEKFTATVKGKNLKEFLREFGASQGLTIVVAKDVDGVVNGRFNLMPSSLMDLMATSFGFIWHVEGNVIYVNPANDVKSEVVKLSGVNAGRLRQALEELDIPDRRYPITYDNRQNTALVSGPSRYVDLVVQTAKSIDQNQTPGSSAEVRVFPLKYAWAGDFTYIQGGREQLVPGVASVLGQLYGNGNTFSSTFAAGQFQSSRTRSALDSLRGLGAFGSSNSSVGRGFANPIEEANPVISQPNFSPNNGSNGGLPQFRADGRMNAVIVRDLPERMRSHEATVKALDIKPGLVEIEVRIIEVNTEAVESLGIDWRLRSRRVDLQVGNSGSLPTLSWGTALSDTAPVGGPNGAVVFAPAPAGVLTTVLGDAGKFLITRVNALAQQGKANMLSSPKIMTLDNVEAVMENLSTFFVRVAGNLDVNLFDVSVGTSLRVTPLIVTEGNKQEVKLAIRIEDGALTGQSVDQVPIVRRSTITTQSFIGDGQALLIAGYSQQSESDDENGIPGLSSAPVVGRLFKNTDKRKSRVERFFLLTPRVVSL